MMKYLGAVMALLVLLLVSPANAANELGLFFGEYPGVRPPASVYALVTPFAPIRAHLVLCGPTMPQLAGWACSVGLQGTAYLFDVTFYHGGVNAGDFPELSVQYPSPIATEDGLVLMTLWYLPRDLEANCLALSGPPGCRPARILRCSASKAGRTSRRPSTPMATATWSPRSTERTRAAGELLMPR
ncbi:MAG: hypothetical protein IPH48_15540 [bacterium]|nr:hypothetical protein [bacterium]